MDTQFFLRHLTIPTLILAITADEVARVKAGEIPGSLIESPAPDGQHYCREFDRWFAPSDIPEGMTAEQFFASQPGAGEPLGVPPKWWTDADAPDVDDESASDPIDDETSEEHAEAEPAPAASPEPAAPVTGSSEPGFVPTPHPVPEDPREHAQVHINRLHALIDVIKTKLSADAHWAADEMRTILHELGARKS